MRKRGFVLIAIIVVVAGVAAPASAQRSASDAAGGPYAYVVPAAASSGGLNGTSWLTDLVIHNPWGTEVTATVYLLEKASDSSGADGVDVTIARESSLEVDDVVATLLGSPSTVGALLVAADWPVYVSSRTENRQPGGSYGQLIPGLKLTETVHGRDEARLLLLDSDADFRTNIGFANISPDPLEATVVVHDLDGTVLAETTITVPGFAFTQESDLLRRLGVGSVTGATATVQAGSADARYVPYASVVDRRSGDPTFVLPARASATPMTIAAVASTPGLNGTAWQTSLELHNPGDVPVSAELELRLRSGGTASATVELAGGESWQVADVVAGLFAAEGAGSLRVVPSGGAVMAASRTFNNGARATFGQAIPPALAADRLESGDGVELVQLRSSDDPEIGFRTNLGFVSEVDIPIIVDVLYFADDGMFLGSEAVDLGPRATVQHTDVFTGLGAGNLDAGFAIVRSTTPGAGFFTYASVVDNRTGDPMYVVPKRIPTGDDVERGADASPLVATAGM